MTQNLVPLIIFSFTMAFTPGPNNIMITASGVNFGFRRSLPHMLGIAIGFFVMVVGVGFGLSHLFLLEPRLQTALKIIGSAYLIFLAWKISQIAPPRTAEDAQIKGHPLGFFQAALFQWINPKAWVSVVGTLSAFTTVGGNMRSETFLIGVVSGLSALVSVIIWGGFGTLLSPMLAQPRARQTFNYTMAALLILSLIPVFLS